MSLGLEHAGFEPVFVSELHDDALASYLINRPGALVNEEPNHVNDITEVTRSSRRLRDLCARLNEQHDGVDLLVGGPPCQGYSGIGHRRSFVVSKEQIPSNHLYRDMAAFISELGPKAFVFENVKGLKSARWTPGGSPGEIWRDVESAFAEIRLSGSGDGADYFIRAEVVRASDYGVPQNRPRVLMVGIRRDCLPDLDESLPAGGLLPEKSLQAPSIVEVLSDLDDPEWMSEWVTRTYPLKAGSDFQRRMRRDPETNLVRGRGAPVSEQVYSHHRAEIVEKFDHMIRFHEIPVHQRTKKFAQRVLPREWGPKGPLITVASIPDDYVHYNTPRVLSVREWARLQTFPDWYQFVGARTTGGRRRAGDPSVGDWARDVPKYTQIGNAVPPDLARSVGIHLRHLLGL